MGSPLIILPRSDALWVPNGDYAFTITEVFLFSPKLHSPHARVTDVIWLVAWQRFPHRVPFVSGRCHVLSKMNFDGLNSCVLDMKAYKLCFTSYSSNFVLIHRQERPMRRMTSTAEPDQHWCMVHPLPNTLKVRFRSVVYRVKATKKSIGSFGLLVNLISHLRVYLTSPGSASADKFRSHHIGSHYNIAHYL